MPRPRKINSEIVKKLPSSENGVSITCEDVNGKQFRISHSLKTGKFTLWEILDEGLKAVKSGKSTYELYELIDFGKLEDIPL